MTTTTHEVRLTIDGSPDDANLIVQAAAHAIGDRDRTVLVPYSYAIHHESGEATVVRLTWQTEHQS